MKKINLKLYKNDDLILDYKNIPCIKSNNTSFILNKDKYIISNLAFTKITESEKIILDFKTEKCIIELLENNNKLNLDIKLIEYKDSSTNIDILYKIETEENILNRIFIEYI